MTTNISAQEIMWKDNIPPEMKSLLDAIPAIVWIAHDPGCEKITGNRAAAEFLRMVPDSNLSKTAPLGEQPRHFTVWKDGKEIPSQDLPVQLAARGMTITDFEEEVVFEDGSRRHLIGNASPLYDEQGKVRGAIAAFRDVTERVQAEVELERFFNLIPDMVCIASTDGYFKKLNKEWERVLGYEQSELLATPFTDLIHPDDREATFREVEQQVAGHATARFINRYRAKDGSYRWFEWNATPSPDGTLLFAAARDITERKQAEETLRKSEEKFRAISSSTPDHILMQDLDLRYEFVVNPQIGLTEQDMLGKRDHDFMSKEDADNLTRIKKQVLESGQTTRLEVPVRSRDGQQGYFEGAFTPRFDSAGKVTGLIGYFKDVTARKQAEEALRESEERYKSLFKNNHAPMLLIDPDNSVIVDVNPAACAYYGWNREELLTKKINEINTLTPQEVQAEMQLAMKEKRRHFLFKHRMSDGTIRDVEVFSGPIVLSGKTLLYSIVHDITERKEAEDALQKAYEEKQALLKELQHRVKNSFNLVVSMARLMEGATQNQEAKTALSGISSRVKAMAELYDLLYVNDDVTNTRLDEYCARVTRSFLTPENINFRQSYEAVNVSVKTATPVGLILTELITNALKYAFPDGRSGTVDIALSETPASVLLEVRDNGVGLSDDFNLAASNSLGLTLVDALTRQINGNFRMERDNGTRCVLDFPIDD